MFTYSPHYFELLKESVLLKAGIKSLIPSECQRLSILIFTVTRKRVSETTLKRIFGFAISRFNPSPFTLQTMAEYCGYSGWEEFCEQDNAAVTDKTETTATWKGMCTRAGRITRFTLQSLKKRSGIPFDLTIGRKFMADHLADFLQSGKPVTLFTAPSGYGKTIGLCHEVDKLLAENSEEQCDANLVLFFSSIAITNVSPNELNLGNWLLSFLGLQGKNSLIELFEEKENGPANFYFIIDGFEEHMFKPEQFLLFFNQLVDVISWYSRYSWFKVIITMRAATWINYRHLIESKPQLLEMWHTGFMQDERKAVNLLPFSTDELLALSQKINPANQPLVLPPPPIIKKLSNPLLFQLYYQQHPPQEFAIDEADTICFYQMISGYAINKIYHGTNSMEKILLLKNLLELIDYKNGQLSIHKIRLYELIKANPATYRELIYNDVLREENLSKILRYEELVSFRDNALLEYCLARKLYGWNGEKLDRQLILEMKNLLEGSMVKVPVIRWMVFFIISSNCNEQLNQLRNLSLQPSEKLEVIIFTCQMLQKQFRDSPDHAKLKSNFSQNIQDETFGFLLSLQYISPDYEKALLTLLNFDLNKRNKALIYTTLSVINILNLNADGAEKHIQQLAQIKDLDQEGFVINPLQCLDTVFSYLKYGIVKKEALQQITHLYYNDSSIRRLSPLELSNNEIVLKLALLTLKIADNPYKELRFIRMVRKYTVLIDSRHTSPIDIFFLSMSATAYLKAGNTRMALRTQSKILKIQHSGSNLFTPFMKILFNILSIRSSAHNQATKVALVHVRSLMAYSNKEGFKLAEAYAGISYLSAPQSKDAAPEDLHEIYNQTLRLVRSSGFRLESFLSTAFQKKFEKNNKNVNVSGV